MKKTLICGLAVTLLSSCAHKNTGNSNTYIQAVPKVATVSNQAAVMPNATAFRMSGDYANNVAITLSPDGSVAYFPAPTDVTADSEPISLGDGWWLNCQGFGPNSVFTKYTFAEYAALPSVPSASQLKLDVIPGARVTQFIELPMKQREAVQNIDAVKEYLKSYK